MQLFFAISIICFPAVVWAGIVLTRRIRADRQPDRTSSLRLDFVQHLFNAGVDDERSLEPRKITYQTFRDITAQKSWNQSPEAVTVRPSHKLRLDLRQSGAEEFPLKREPPQTPHRVRYSAPESTVLD